MGFSFALHWAQHAHLNILAREQVPGAQSYVVDFCPVPDVQSGVGQIIYVDNGIYLSAKKGAAGAAQIAAQAALEKYGLPIHDIEPETDSLAVLGWEMNASGVKVATARRWKLRTAVTGILERPFLSGDQLEVLLGHFSFALLLDRCCISVFRSCFTFAKRYPRRVRRVWRSVLRELKLAASLLTLVECQFSKPWSPVVTVSDAAPSGYAIHEGIWGSEDVRRVGGFAERWRFRRSVQPQPRNSALEAWRHFAEVEGIRCEDSGWELDGAFPEVDPGLIAGARWKKSLRTPTTGMSTSG